MTYCEENGTVTLTMTRDDYDQLTLMLGFAAGAAPSTGDREWFYRSCAFVNRLNAGNPLFRPYEIPEEYAP